MKKLRKLHLSFDLDGTICHIKKAKESYTDLMPINGMKNLINSLKKEGHTIVIHTARGMKSHNGNLKEIKKHVLPTIVNWLKKHKISYDEIVIGKPNSDCFIDDKAIKFTSAKNLKNHLNKLWNKI